MRHGVKVRCEVVGAGSSQGLLICYDVEFPENVRALALGGADFVIVPTALMQPFDVVARTIVPARAYENQLFLAYVDRCGREGAFDYCGLSCVGTPRVGTRTRRPKRGTDLRRSRPPGAGAIETDQHSSE